MNSENQPYLGLESLGHRVNQALAVRGPAAVFARTAAPFPSLEFWFNLGLDQLAWSNTGQVVDL